MPAGVTMAAIEESIVSRRDWLAGATVAAATAAMPTLARAAQPKNMYIDAHSHVWSPDTAKWPLAKGQTAADLKPPSFTPEELLKLAEPEGVGRVVLIQHSVYH